MSRGRILVLHGAKKNVGDFLIRERGLALLRHLRPDAEIVTIGRWEPLDETVARSVDAIVLCGGPGLREDFYPETFRLVPDLESLEVPILPLALGWSGRPADAPEKFSFNEESKRALRTILEGVGWGSVRDDVSLDVVRRADVGEFRRTGCAAWYHLPSLGSPIDPVGRVRSVVFTPPAASRELMGESVRLMRLLRARYRGAERYCVFHRGLRPDRFTRRREAAAVLTMAARAKALGFKVVDAAFDLSRIDFYEHADLHVGYRVHAHLAFLSYRRPSLLIAEDGRGIGQAQTLGDEYHLRAGEPDVVETLGAALAREEMLGQPALARAVEEIERTWLVMRETIEQVPA